MRQILPHSLTGSLDSIRQEYKDEWDAFELLQLREMSLLIKMGMSAFGEVVLR